MTGVEVAEACTVYAKEFRKAGKSLPLFAVIAARALLTLMNESEARLMGHVLDRTEGKVAQPIDLGWRELARQQGQDPEVIFRELVNAARNAMAGSRDSGSDTNGE